MNKKIHTALISVFYKDGLEETIRLLDKHGVKIISTGGTAEFIRKLGVKVTEVEEITGFPSVFGGRVKTLHPLIAGGILKIRGDKVHEEEAKKYNIPEIDLVISNLYPFENTLAKAKEVPTEGRGSATRDKVGVGKKIIETIDIGGVTLIREAAKNFKDVVIISSQNQYQEFCKILEERSSTTLEERKKLAGEAFEVTSLYDTAIRGYFQGTQLRYGENPHQGGYFIGDLEKSFTQLEGKELSYNNLLDTEAAISLVYDFEEPAFAIIKHLNSCGLALAEEGKLIEAYRKAYTADPLSAFGGILAANREIGEDIAALIEKQKLFIEVIIAPEFSREALKILSEKKNIRILKWLNPKLSSKQIRTSFNGLLLQDRDAHIEKAEDLRTVTKREPTTQEKKDLLMAAVATKHLKSNAVALVKDGVLIAMGCGQTSRIDALKQAIDKAERMKFSLKGAVMSSEAFFPFPDCVEMAAEAAISAIIQPGGSKNDQASINEANKHNLAMVFSGFRHFKH